MLRLQNTAHRALFLNVDTIRGGMYFTARARTQGISQLNIPISAGSPVHEARRS